MTCRMEPKTTKRRWRMCWCRIEWFGMTLQIKLPRYCRSQ